MKPKEISNEFKRTWATWSILYSGGSDGSEQAFKRFDRIRYPVNLQKDMHILIDTWGSDWQNPARTNPKYSDAHLHGQSYVALSAFMAAPSCFMLTQFLEPTERDELRKIIGLYKTHRKGIWENYVFPIGEEPNNASWTGFQMADSGKRTGYLMVFRELHNTDPKGRMRLKFVGDREVKLTDLERPEGNKDMRVMDGVLELTISKPEGYRFLRYEVVGP